MNERFKCDKVCGQEELEARHFHSGSPSHCQKRKLPTLPTNHQQRTKSESTTSKFPSRNQSLGMRCVSRISADHLIVLPARNCDSAPQRRTRTNHPSGEAGRQKLCNTLSLSTAAQSGCGCYTHKPERANSRNKGWAKIDHDPATAEAFQAARLQKCKRKNCWAPPVPLNRLPAS